MSFSFSFFRTLLVDLHNDDDLDLEIICNFSTRKQANETAGFSLIKRILFFRDRKKNGKFRDLKKFIQGNEAMIYGGI